MKVTQTFHCLPASRCSTTQRRRDPSTLPKPLDPADLASAMWDLYVKRDRFEDVIGNTIT